MASMEMLKSAVIASLTSRRHWSAPDCCARSIGVLHRAAAVTLRRTVRRLTDAWQKGWFISSPLSVWLKKAPRVRGNRVNSRRHAGTPLGRQAGCRLTGSLLLPGLRGFHGHFESGGAFKKPFLVLGRQGIVEPELVQRHAVFFDSLDQAVNLSGCVSGCR